MDLLGGDAEESPGPGPAPLEILDHLDLINDGDLVSLVKVGHLDSARHVIRGLLLGPRILPLLARHLNTSRKSSHFDETIKIWISSQNEEETRENRKSELYCLNHPRSQSTPRSLVLLKTSTASNLRGPQ